QDVQRAKDVVLAKCFTTGGVLRSARGCGMQRKAMGGGTETLGARRHGLGASGWGPSGATRDRRGAALDVLTPMTVASFDLQENGISLDYLATDDKLRSGFGPLRNTFS